MTHYSVFGKPVLHSKSPQLFRTLLKAGDVFTRIRPQTADDLISIVKLLDIKGASVTSPFKESILPLLDQVSASARVIGAVNCIRFKNGAISGHNTDHVGVTAALSEAGITLPEARILVLGAGGAARAAVYGLTTSGAEVFVSNRTYSKAENLARTFGTVHIHWENPGIMPYFDAVVSTLLPGALPPFAGYLAYGQLLDAVYKRSKMSEHSRNRGVRIIPGERWLIHQGVAAAAFYIAQPDEKHAPSSARNNDPVDNTTHKAATDDKTKAWAELLGSRLHEVLRPENVRIFVLNETTIPEPDPAGYDLIVSGFGLDEEAVKNIIDEEMRLAFSR
ncbi:MAG: hypothetical protein RG741_01875 [Bacteroidales bacterium]|nr:hypothetical protein [Bacteroidales bacterium]